MIRKKIVCALPSQNAFDEREMLVSLDFLDHNGENRKSKIMIKVRKYVSDSMQDYGWNVKCALAELEKSVENNGKV